MATMAERSIRARVPLTDTSHRRFASTSRSIGRLFSTGELAASVGAPVKDVGSCTLLGTSREQNEDRFDYQFVTDATAPGDINSYVAVFDGHGGIAVAERLEGVFRDQVEEFWTKLPPETAIAESYLEMDRKLLQQPPGFWGIFGERGVGGSKCGATAATAFIFKDEKGTQKLLAANIGDSRVVLIREGKAIQLTQDHVPDIEEERLRIERESPNPRQKLVQFVGGTWRVGGILALSRAFGDAYMKANLNFEGVDAGSDYRTGFGVIANPYISVTDLKKGDKWLLVHTDGLNNTITRGGGGGLSNEEIAEMCAVAGEMSAQTLSEKMAIAAQTSGSTDDVSVVCVKLDF